ncbi:MAG: hypothetical protein KAH20_14405 [Methylococcales bacterium]|nr:hypothetical protein [Methylococcales bacterium]
MIIILPAIITVIFFYYSGKNKNNKGIKWAVTGLIGYLLGFSLAIMIIGETFVSVFIACAVVYFTHTQLSRMSKEHSRIDH